jgi:hypothetical protein
MHEYLMKPAERRRSQRIRAWLLQQCDASPVYAQCLADPKDPFWYKVFFYTPHGVWKCDTGKEYAETKADARLIIRLEKLTQVTFDAVMENWCACGFWSNGRPVCTGLLRTWCERNGRPFRAYNGCWGIESESCASLPRWQELAAHRAGELRCG